MADNNESLLQYEMSGDITIGTIHKVSMLDGSTVTEFGIEVVGYVEEHKGTHMLLNFKQVKYLSSAALTELIRINDALKQGNGSLKVCNVSSDIYKVFKITNFDKLFDIHQEDLDSCIKRFQRAVELSREEDEWENKSKKR